MWKFRSKQTHRDLEILKLLFIAEKSLTIGDLASHLDCDVKTVRTRVLEINENYHFPQIIYNYDTDTVETSYDPSFLPFKIYKDFYENNIEFQVLEYLFLKEHATAYELRDVFGLSESTLFRIIHNLNENLENWDIEIKTRNYEIVGDELAITKFFTQYFTEKMEVSFFEDFTVFQTTIFNIFMDILGALDQYELRPYFNRFQWYSFVSLVRYSQGYLIPNNYQYNHELLMSRINLLKEEDLKSIESLFGISLKSPQTVNDVFYVYFNQVKHVRFNKFIYFKDAVDRLVSEIDQTFLLAFDDDRLNKMSKLVYEAANGYFAQSYFLFDRPFYEIEKLRTFFPKSIDSLQMLLNQFIEDETGISNDALSNYLILFIVNVFPGFYEAMEKYEEKIKVHCFFVSNEDTIERIMQFLIEHFSFIAEFQLHSNHHLPELKGIWIVDIHPLSSQNVLVINPNLITMQSDLIFDFLKMHAKGDE